MTEDDSEPRVPSVTRRGVGKGIATAGLSALGVAALSGTAAAQPPQSDDILVFGDDKGWMYHDVQNGDLVIGHPDGELWRYDTSAGAILPKQQIGTASNRVDHVGDVGDYNRQDTANVGCRATKGSTQTVSTNSETRVAFNGTDFEDSDVVSFDDANNQLNIEVAGVYVLTANIETSDPMGDGTRIITRLKVGSTDVAQQDFLMGGDNLTSVNLSTTMELSQNAKIRVAFFHNAGSDKDLRASPPTNLSAVRLG